MLLFRRSYSTLFKTNDKEHVIGPLFCQPASQAFFVLSCNAPPHRRGEALCDNTKNACEVDYCIEVTSKTRAEGSLSKDWQHTVTMSTQPPIKTLPVMQHD